MKTSYKAISPIDGRYHEITKPLEEFFSEYALFRYRIIVEIKYLIHLSKKGIIRKFSEKEIESLEKIYRNFTEEEMHKIKEIESRTKHDVKAVEYYVKNKFHKTTLSDITEYIHFALTSEDINNISYSLSIKYFLEKIYIKELQLILRQLTDMIKKYKSLPMLSRTHGQPASPTTVGKELAVFAYRIYTQLESLKKLPITAKLNGAVGNYNAHQIAYPDIDWIEFSKTFITSLGLTPNLITTQVESKDNMAAIFQNIVRINNILIDLNRDFWGYISIDYFKQKVEPGQVGSSTMPHKVNPINFENSEGNLKIANSLLKTFSNELTISRFQRDLSDSTILRNIGVSFGHCLIAYDSALKGLKKIHPNEEKLQSDLNLHPEVLTEAIQTMMRKEGTEQGYEMMKNLSQGKKTTIDHIKHNINNSKLSEENKQKLNELTPSDYIGLAEKLCDHVLNLIHI